MSEVDWLMSESARIHSEAIDELKRLSGLSSTVQRDQLRAMKNTQIDRLTVARAYQTAANALTERDNRVGTTVDELV